MFDLEHTTAELADWITTLDKDRAEGDEMMYETLKSAWFWLLKEHPPMRDDLSGVDSPGVQYQLGFNAGRALAKGGVEREAIVDGEELRRLLARAPSLERAEVWLSDFIHTNAPDQATYEAAMERLCALSPQVPEAAKADTLEAFHRWADTQLSLSLPSAFAAGWEMAMNQENVPEEGTRP